MKNQKPNWFAKSTLLVLVAVIFVASTATELQAKRANPSAPKRIQMNNILSSGGGAKASQITNTTAKNRSFILKHSLKTKSDLTKLLCERCACATAAEDLVGFPRCLKGCLADAGVSSVTLILCAGSCAFGAVPLCALCVGVSVAVLEACALGCAAYPDGVSRVIDAARNKPVQRSLQTKRPQIPPKRTTLTLELR